MTTGWKVKAIVVLALQCLNWSFTLSQPAEILQVIDDGLEELTAIPTTDDCHDVCVASGDPHIKTFDCVRYEYHGQCDYTLVKNCGGDLPTFEIIGEFHRQRFHKKLSVIQKLLITCEGTDIELDTDFNVRINGAVLTNVNQAVSFGNIYRFRNAVKVTLDIGITIYWSSPYRVMIRIEPAAAELLNGNLCGLCGNANDIMYDDFTTRDGKLVSDVVVLGDNWRTDEDCGLCHDCVNTICTTNQHNEQQAEELVGNFIDDTAPDCGDNNVEALTQQIKDLLCATLPEVDGACQLVDNYVDVCEENDIPIQKPVNEMCNPGCEVDGVSLPFGSTWINGDCTQECNCGKEMGLQCTDMQCDENASCTPDEEGPSSSCRCNAPDFVGDGIECSPFDPCKPSRCQNDGQCFGVGNQFACICINDFWGPLCQNPPPCSSNPCQNGGTCVNDGGNYRCLCPFGVWGGPTCTIRCYVCWACGDPHYYTLDGQWYDFQGKCMYTLAKSSPDFPNQFEVVGNNIEAYWNSKVSITRQVYVFLDFGADGWFSFCFRYGYFGILVNEAAVSLPYRNFDDNGRVRVDIRQAGSYTLLSTNFGMYVVWNGVHCVCIVVPEYFMNNVYGLCGYFSGDTADDWTKPDNELATSANEFGNSWVYEEVESCQEPCTDDTCIQGDPCVENDREGLANQLCLYLNIDANTGPFVNCFGTINPGQYYANCKYDICAGQNMEAICDDVENYVFDCRAAEITIPANWRDMLPACAIICDETTEEYLECGTGCPATCANPAAPQTCTLQCLAGCQCRAGLLWTPDGCVSPDQCGCTLNGVYYAPNEEFVRDDCSEKCTCRIGGQVECVEYGPCHENAECTVRNGQRGCYCQNGYYGDGFNCVAWYTCGACGDPHYKSFDGVRFDFQGKCTYTLVKTVSGDINFEVIAKNVEWSYNPLTTLTRQLFINVFDQSVWFRHDTTAVYVNDEVVNLPYVLNRQLIVYRVWIYTVLITDFGLQVIWDGNTCVTIRLPDTFMQKVLGLCGFFNGDPSDDFKNLDLTLINTVNGFGNSWEYGNDENCVSCTPEICPEGDPCVDNPGGDDVCAPFKDNGSPFAVCFQKVDPDPFFTDCSYDACSAQTNEPNVCEYFERYVGVCREAGVAINGWRKVHTECAIECRDRMKYTDCGTPCPATCANPNSPNECEQQTCVQGCQCIPGLVLSGDECVEPNQCGCQYNGRYYMPMETFVTSDCGSRCQCVGNNQVSCQQFGCGNNAVCNVRDWVRGCYCQDNYVMLADGRNCEPTSPCDPNPCENGGECIESADRTSYVCNCPYGQWAGPTCNIRCYLCYACGDPHYKTFDGRYYDYQGKCQYTLVKSLSDAPNEFEVVANNIEWAYYPTVSITRAIYVMITVGGKDNVFSFESSSSVRVNDIAVNIPYYLLNEDGSTHLVVRKFGYYTVLWTEFGLIVEWNGYSCVRLYLPESYKTYVAGLCGLFNGDSSDDFTDPDHTLLPDTNSFGNSWVHGQCENPCTPETCPVDPCEGNAEATMEAELLCRELKADNQFSPFKDCFDDVDPDQYFHNCKFDKCIDPDRSDTLCEAFNLYVTACRDAGISIGNWRASVEACTTECGENMEYQFCGTACPATCSEGAAEAICNTQCVESCQCVTGYVWNNEECVPQDECGCTDKGRYYEVGQTVVSDDCKTECTCEAGGNLQCEQVRDKCNENEVCEIRNGKRGCYCPYGFFYSNEGICQPRFTCVACGDPHYVTWEGKRYDYMGRCSYILAKSHDSAPNSFMIVGDNIPWERNPRATVTRYVYTYAYGLTVKFSWDTKAVLVDDEAVNLPFYFEDHLVVYSSGFYKVLVTDFGLQVIWDGHSCVFIRVPAMFMNYVDGLCGHLSQDQSDDFTNPDGGIEADVNTFGDKWAFGEDCLPCTPETCLTGDPCDDADAAAVADRVCSALTDAETPFAACFSVLDAKRTELLRDCRYDTCADPEDEEASCGYLQQYADACREAGVNVNGWREAIPICAIECGEFMRYSDCGSACPATCINPLASEECDRPCVQGCQCLPGLVLSGDKCVAIEECGCTDAGKYYTNGQQFIVPDCNSTCVCTSGKLTCTDMTCDENAVCALQNGVRGCYCRGYYEGDGISCTAPCDQDQHPCRNGAQCVDADNDDGFICRCPEGRTGPRCDQDLLLCRASGDPHYVNFDGEKFDFQGGCEYVLAQSCNENITDFKVLVDNNPSRWNPRVALTKTVTVEVYNQKIVLDQGKVVRINDDGVATIPVNDPNFSIYMSGSYVVIKTDFNLKVEWNGYTTVKVKVPVEFAGNLCGLCGNGNGGNGDDMVTRDGQAESNINHWGHSWATNADICDICEDCLTEDACDTADVDIVENANDYCNIITATTGVFGPTGEVNPGPIEPVVPVPAAPVIPKEGKRELSYIKRSVPDTFLLQARDISEESHQDIQSEVSISGDRREHERQRRKRQSSPEMEQRYVFSIPGTSRYTSDPYLLVTTSSSIPVNVNVVNHGISYEIDVIVSNEEYASITLPRNSVLSGTGLSNNTFIISSSGDISVHVMNSGGANPDGSVVIPISQLGESYYIASYQSLGSSHASEFSISALGEETNVYIKLADEEEYQTLLKPYESYHRQDYGADLTGTFVTADKAVAILSGTTGSGVPSTNGLGWDALLEQMPPLTNWGDTFVLAPFMGRSNGFEYRVIAQENTDLTISDDTGDQSIQLQSSEFYPGETTGNSVVTITANKPVLVVQYLKSSGPSMIVTQPVESYGHSVIFPVYKLVTQYITVITDCKYLQGLILDDEISIAEWDSLATIDNSMCIVRGQIDAGVHAVSNNDPEATFAVSVYASSTGSSYAYNAAYGQVGHSVGTVYASGITVRWSATGVRPGQRDPLVVNTTIRYYELSDDISGTGLWKLSMYGSANSDGTGDKFQHTEQILSEAQQALPLEGHADIMFVESEGTLDILSLGCEMEFRYLCFDFTRGDNPNPDYTFVSFQVPATKLTLCSDRCFQPPEPPPVTVTGLEVRIGHYGIRADVKDAFTANTTVHFASTSPDVIGNGLWKLSIYGSKTPDGTLDHYQHIDQVLTASQQAQSLIGGADIVFIGSEGEINIHGLGCGEFQYLCVDFMKGEDPSVDFTFESLQAQSDKFTVCILIPCQEDMDIDISGGFILVTDLTGAIRISALDQLAFQEIPLEGLAVPVAVDFDPVDQMLYWTDVNLKTISRAYLDGTGQETVLNLGSGSIADGMTLDVQRRVMYWTDTGYDRIERSNLDGSARTIIFDMDSQEPRAIVVDSNNGVLYWTDWGSAPKIERGKVDGSERVVLVDTDLLWPNGLAIDFPGGRIYWADAGLNKIESTDFVGKDRKLLLSTGSNVDLHPFDIGIYQDTILWSDWNFTRVLTMDKNIPGRAALTGNAVFARAGGLHIQYGGCTDEDGNFTPEGQTSGDPCMPCMCLNKESSCYVIDCAPPPEELPGQKCTPIVVQGECCPTYRCRQIVSPPCIADDGTEVPEGETVGDACSPCTCTGGELLCLAYQCVQTEPPLGFDCKLVIIEGDCCPTWSCQAGDGPFINCHGVIDPAEFFNDCRFDWCATQSNEQFCEDVAAYAEACQQQGIPIGPWRDAVGCALECPTYSHYEVCPSACQQTCADLNAETEVCAFFCHEGCVCDDGYILEGNKCIPAVACGCVDNDGRYHRQGATVITETCDQQCVCESAGDGWNCAALPGCGSNSECVIRDSERRCYCKDGYVLQGEDCARGCLWGGDFIQYSTRRFADRTCSTGCYCDELTELVCTDISCHSDALCVADPASSLYQCQCPEGYIGDGVSFCAPLIPPGFP